MGKDFTPGSVSELLDRLKAGDHAAAADLWRRYFPRLVELARRKLRAAHRPVGDEEDAALSAFDSFCRRAERGDFPDLKDREGLWALLVVLTARKAADLRRHGGRLKRGGGLVRDEAALADGSTASAAPGVDGLPADGVPPDEAALLAEEVEGLLGRLPDRTLREVAVWKLEGYTNAEIAARHGCSVPTVERRLAVIRRILRPQ